MSVDPASPYQTGPNGSDLWIRKWALTLKGASGDLTLSQSNNDPEQDGLRITFRTAQWRTSTPGQAVVTVYNPKAATSLKALAKEYTRAILAAGYQNGRYGVIFDGFITEWEHGREETLTETYLRLHLQDSDLAQNSATINQTLTSGHSVYDVAKACADAMEAYGTKIGGISGVATVPLPRAQVLYGSPKQVLGEYGLSFFTQNGVLYIFDPRQPISGQTKVLNSMTGLVGMPQQTVDGVYATTLLDPALLIGAQIQIDQKDINQIAAGVDLNGQPLRQTPGTITVKQGYGPAYFADTSADGIYTAIVIEHEGDSRGDPWYSHVSCWAVGAAAGAAGKRLLDYAQGPTAGQLGAAKAAQSVPDWGTGGP